MCTHTTADSALIDPQSQGSRSADAAAGSTNPSNANMVVQLTDEGVELQKQPKLQPPMLQSQQEQAAVLSRMLRSNPDACTSVWDVLRKHAERLTATKDAVQKKAAASHSADTDIANAPAEAAASAAAEAHALARVAEAAAKANDAARLEKPSGS